MDTIQIIASAALHNLRTIMTEARSHLERAETVPQLLRDLGSQCVNVLDFYLTGSTSCRKMSELEDLWEGAAVYLHLSNGGWSRLSLDLCGAGKDPIRIVLDRGLSTQLSVQRWDAIAAKT